MAYCYIYPLKMINYQTAVMLIKGKLLWKFINLLEIFLCCMKTFDFILRSIVFTEHSEKIIELKIETRPTSD